MADDPRPNEQRGENSVVLGEVTFVLRPDFEAVQAVDAALGGVTGLVRRAVQQPETLKLRELAVVVTEGIRAHGRKTGSATAHSGVDTVERMIFAAGIPTVIPAVTRFLVAAITGGAKDEPGNG